MRFKTDENLHPELAHFLRQKGHDAVTVWDQGLRGRPDANLAAVCQAEARAIVTLDAGFADIRAYPPGSFRASLSCALPTRVAGTCWRYFLES